MRRAAERWRDAATNSERKSIFDKYGVRWSPLWKLSYWNPTQQLVVDSMHCLLEGLVKFHVLDALGLSERDAPVDSRVPPAISYKFAWPGDSGVGGDEDHEPDVNNQEAEEEIPGWTANELKSLQLIHRNLMAALSSDTGNSDADVRTPTDLEGYLSGRHLHALQFVAQDVGIWAPSQQATRRELAVALTEWVSLSPSM